MNKSKNNHKTISYNSNYVTGKNTIIDAFIMVSDYPGESQIEPLFDDISDYPGESQIEYIHKYTTCTNESTGLQNTIFLLV